MSDSPKRGWLKWGLLLLLFVGVAGGVALLGSVGAGVWVASGGLMSTEERVAAHCEAAVTNARLFGADAPTPTAAMERDCQDDFLAMGDEASLAALECQAEAETAADWRACFAGGALAVAEVVDVEEVAEDEVIAPREEGEVGEKEASAGSTVEIAVQQLDREIATNAGLLGSLTDEAALDGVFSATSLDSDHEGGPSGPSVSIGVRGTQTSSGGLASRTTTPGEPGAPAASSPGTRGRGPGAGNFASKRSGGIGAIGGDPVILGALDKSLIDAVIKRNMNQIRYCYQRELPKYPELSGKIVVKFVVAKDGTVSSATTKTSTMNNKAVEACLNSRFLRIKFPEPKGGGIVIVSYPFVFRPG